MLATRLRRAVVAPGAEAVAGYCAALAVLVAGLAAYFAVPPGSGVSALVHITTGEPLARYARHVDPGFDLLPVGSHYDGAYFYAIARDPLALGPAHRYLDESAYRYGHALYGQLAGALSFGSASAVPWTLLIVSLAGVALAAYCAARIAAQLGWSPWAGLVVALSPGLVYATTADTSEAATAGLIALAVLTWQRRQFGRAALAFTAVALCKEPLALVPIGVLLYELVRVRRAGRLVPGAWADHRVVLGRAMLALGVGPVVLLAWLIYVAQRFGAWPGGQYDGLSAVPFAGIRDTLRYAAIGRSPGFLGDQVSAAALPLVLVVVTALVIATVLALRLRTVVDGVFLATGPLVFFFGPLNLLYPKDLLRLTAIPLLLVPAVLCGARRRNRAGAAAPSP